jgi:hypothetical protein
MYISSNGALTAGRKNPDNALFPYYTDDIIHDSAEKTGSKTILQVKNDDSIYLWEPFSNKYLNAYNIDRNVYKNIPGNKIIFEEINHDLELTFSYSWLNSDRFGFVKKSVILNNGLKEVNIEFIDGIQNILPYGIDQQFQAHFSTLADGYKKNELLSEPGIGVYTLSSIPSDKAEPSESLKSTTVWSIGIKADNYLLSSRQLNNFRSGRKLVNETDIRAARGAYLLNSRVKLEPGKSEEWIFVAEINQDSSDLANLVRLVNNDEDLFKTVLEDVEKGTENLIRIVGASDGLQLTGNQLDTSRHFANTLFNVMRGGIFDDAYKVDKHDFISFIKSVNTNVFDRQQEYLNSLEENIGHSVLINDISRLNDSEFIKLSLEYLPITFSRRHGDPSRPWNRFSIDIKDDEGNKLLNYQGNWRDIFQNWEALAESYPDYIESMITKFLNGSTADGYNPYRVTRDKFDWEIPEADMPWANIGYWGDHQIIYLLKLLEFSVKHNSTKLLTLFDKDVFVYTNVPYRIKKYKDLLADPHNTIDFDHTLNKSIETTEQEYGSDARCIRKGDNTLFQVNLVEKLLAALLSKLSNFIPGGGIWMNTQRPEWNDANNALVGYGVSMVTLYYLRRYVAFLLDILSKSELKSVSISAELNTLLSEIMQVFSANEKLLDDEITDRDRKVILDGLGEAGSKYRQTIYGNGFSFSKDPVDIVNILALLDVSQKFIEHTIRTNRREDGLYHAYNLMSVENENEINIHYIYAMLEGQVAVLSSGYLKTGESIQLLEALRKSELYRENQNSYILYPDRELSLFINKNNVPEKDYNSSLLLKKLIELGNRDIVTQDVNGGIHFSGDIKNAAILKSKLDEIDVLKIPENNNDEKEKVLAIYELVFNHKFFTGRSGTFYKYEGLGSIYWHMVSKLVLAVQETFFTAQRSNAGADELTKLRSFYYDIKDGIGVHKSPENYGAFPTDPYSHTPGFSGVQQPGMTGQVKEDIISRFGELGIFVNDGEIIFNHDLLNMEELLSEESEFEYIDVNGGNRSIRLNPDSLAFTYCQVPVVYMKSDVNKIIVYMNNEKKSEFNEIRLNREISRAVFGRNGTVEKIEVSVIR